MANLLDVKELLGKHYKLTPLAISRVVASHRTTLTRKMGEGKTNHEIASWLFRALMDEAQALRNNPAHIADMKRKMTELAKKVGVR